MDKFEIATIIEKEGGRLYLVGGAVRDALRRVPVHDEDYCVTGITAEKFNKLFPMCHIRGKSFEVFDLEGKEFAMARTETKAGTGHKEFEIITGKEITIEQDLARRDITINAMAQDVLTGELVDPYNGKQDLENKLIRATTNHFSEDPLRVYRVARFAATLGFSVEENTTKLMESLKNELSALSSERVFMELSKAISADKPSIFFEVLKQANVLEIHFKEIEQLIGALQPEKYHPEGDAYNHTMLALDASAKMTDKKEVRFATLVHDLGKGITPKEEYPHHYNHEITGIELVAKLCNRIKAPTSWKKCGKVACKEHMRGGIFYKMRPSKQVDFIERVAKSYLGLEGLQIVVNADRASSRNIDTGNIDFASIGKACLSAIDGEYITKKYDIKPGIEFGEKLRAERIKWIKSV